MRSWLIAIVLAGTACFSSLDQQHWWEALRVQPLTEGESRTYSADLDHTIAAVSTALTEARFDQHTDCHPKIVKGLPDCNELVVTRLDDSTQIIMATKTERGFESGWLGTQARFILRNAGPARTKVTILSMYRDHRLLGGGDYAPALFRTMDRELAAKP